MFPAMLSQMQQLSNQVTEVKLLVNELASLEENTWSILYGVERVEDKLRDKEMEEKVTLLLLWLSPLQPQKRHDDVRSKRYEETGGWFLNSPKFDTWRQVDGEDQARDSAKNIFACYGIPGAGKSVMSSLVIDNLLDESFTRKDIYVMYLYCDYRDRLQQNVENMVGELLRQAIIALRNGLYDTDDILDSLFQLQIRGKLDISVAINHLMRCIAKFKKSYVCIDALDKSKDEVRKIFLLSLGQMLGGLSGPMLRIFLTGRPQVEPAVQHNLGLTSPITG
ncbi:Similar to hypothetical protein AOR_1_932164 [Aspergillus oryzae RIB40]; acc. no. XP_003189429 [Pyronema omphalodes CBS 100304]|uniref:Nephrocystin 3-like N-terminal domain-containing protein n=1 Tax=Pyronema omphalodes (strain CBS 100304) TaxID=1076935 RepID=U4LUE6_PYROM|nr:Similar to hypothetical protein AOR_1_932164 [Aspergillus oryzae RIB40]; acc. no. XP_003189429 [Pyronema omphalodes CBS 100304]